MLISLHRIRKVICYTEHTCLGTSQRSEYWCVICTIVIFCLFHVFNCVFYTFFVSYRLLSCRLKKQSHLNESKNKEAFSHIVFVAKKFVHYHLSLVFKYINCFSLFFLFNQIRLVAFPMLLQVDLKFEDKQRHLPDNYKFIFNQLGLSSFHFQTCMNAVTIKEVLQLLKEPTVVSR